VEQNVRLALEVADYAYVLESGHVRLEGGASRLIDHPSVTELYLAVSRKQESAGI
jgi:branched-chain amino acid transport system ATP-binding protein